jgi:hypothetical protein
MLKAAQNRASSGLKACQPSPSAYEYRRCAYGINRGARFPRGNNKTRGDYS